MNPEDQLDRGQTGRRAAQSQARAALVEPQKRGLGPFPLVPINTPRGSSGRDIQSFRNFMLI